MKRLLSYALIIVLGSCEKEIDYSIRVQEFTYQPSEVNSLSPFQDCVEYQDWDGVHLKIKRTNVVFNCGLDSIEVYTVPSDSVIKIFEIGHVTLPAYCNGTFNMEYTVGPLEPGKNYSIIITEYSVDKKTFSFTTQMKAGESCHDQKLYQ
ncbi:MAG TPA: hypothetical protein VIH57_26345 [Bacteroidales bacterium]